MAKIKAESKESFLDKLQLIGAGDERTFFVENLSIMLAAGLTISQALETITESLNNKAMARITKQIQADVDEGMNLNQALSKTNLLPPYAVSLIQIGEESGMLVEDLKSVANQMAREEDLKSKLRSAMIYPIMVFSVTLVVGLGVAWFILPRLAKVFANLKLKLPLITRILINFANVLSKDGLWLVPALIAVIGFGMYFLFYNRHTSRIGQAFLLKFPITKRLITQIELSRMGYILSSLLKAGVPIVDTLKLLAASTEIYNYKNFYRYLVGSFDDGNSFKVSFEKYPRSKKLIEPAIQQIIISSEQSGKLAQSFSLIGERYEKKTEDTVKNLPVILEPIFLVIIWLAVLGVAMAVILPIYSLVGNLNGSKNTTTNQNKTQKAPAVKGENISTIPVFETPKADSPIKYFVNADDILSRSQLSSTYDKVYLINGQPEFD